MVPFMEGKNIRGCLVTSINWFDDTGNRIKNPRVGDATDAKKVFLREYRKKF